MLLVTIKALCAALIAGLFTPQAGWQRGRSGDTHTRGSGPSRPKIAASTMIWGPFTAGTFTALKMVRSPRQ